MKSQILLHLIFYLLSVNAVWRLILKKSSYPDCIPTRIKITHAIILFYLFVNGFSGANRLAWLLMNSQSSIWKSPFDATIELLAGIASVGLIPVCYGMARRRPNMLKWYFLVWPVTFISSSCAAIIREQGIVRIQAITIGIASLTIIFILSLSFYLRRSSQIIFKE